MLEGSEVKVHWSTPATYVIQDDRVNADRFQQHYEALKQMKLAKLTIPVSPALANTWVYFEREGDQLRPYVYSLPRQATSRFTPPQPSEDEGVVVSFHVEAFPITSTQQPPEDKHWVIGLFAPGGSMTWTHGGYLPPHGVLHRWLCVIERCAGAAQISCSCTGTAAFSIGYLLRSWWP